MSGGSGSWWSVSSFGRISKADLAGNMEERNHIYESKILSGYKYDGTIT